MNELPYKVEHLEVYTGILTEHNIHDSTFKMELNSADNPVLERSVDVIEASIELEFRYGIIISTLFFHDRLACPLRNSQKEQCHECKDTEDRYFKFEAELEKLQIGDTFKISAALINGKLSELPMRIHSFKDYEPLTAACTEYGLRLPDTEEGIKKKQELVDQSLKAKRDAKKNRREEKIAAKWQKRKDSIKQYFGKKPNLNQIIVIVVGTTIANQLLPKIFNLVKDIYHSFVSN